MRPSPASIAMGAIDKAILRHFDLDCLTSAQEQDAARTETSGPPLLTGDDPKPPA